MKKEKTMKQRDEMRVTAIDRAIQYHSQIGGRDPRPDADEVIATAQKFLGFLLLEKKAAQPRG